MKNVAGYDLSRLMAGSLGTLGLILDVSVKVLPCPEAEMTLRQEMPAGKGIAQMNEWLGSPCRFPVWRGAQVPCMCVFLGATCGGYGSGQAGGREIARGRRILVQSEKS